MSNNCRRVDSCDMFTATGDCRADVIFVLDSSANNGAMGWFTVKQFVIDLVQSLKVQQICGFLSLCLSVSLSLSVCLHACMHVCLSVCLSVCLYVCLSVCLSLSLSLSLSPSLSLCVFACACACAHMYINLSCISIYVYYIYIMKFRPWLWVFRAFSNGTLHIRLNWCINNNQCTATVTLPL